MNLTYTVPLSVQRAATRTLELHRTSPLEDVHGIRVAEALSSGRVTIDVVARMHRFFTVNEREQASEAQNLRSEADSPLMRSWLLHGAEAGQRWAAEVYRKAQREGYQPTDETVGLLRCLPDEIYACFSAGAWRWEYDLDPKKAARFVEEYFRSTGLNLELHRAFGASAGAVGTALHRRFHSPDPFREAALVLEYRDTEHRLAAELDLQEMIASIGPVQEALQSTLWKGVLSDAQAAKIVWAPFVAYIILAVERPDLLAEMNKGSKRPPELHQDPSPWSQYNDAINTYVTWFHPKGAKYDDPSKDDKFAGLPEQVFDLMHRAFFGKNIVVTVAHKTLGAMRRWTAQNKKAGSLFHVYNADWKKANWQHILDALPEDADVRGPFTEFVKGSPMPAAGVKLQQTLSDKKTKEAVLAFLRTNGYLGPTDELDPVKVGTTLSGGSANVLGTPLGVYSVLRTVSPPSEVIALGAYKASGGVRMVFADKADPKKLIGALDMTLAQNIANGNTTIVQAHADMPGTVYGTTAAPKPPTPEVPPPAPVDEPSGPVGSTLAAAPAPQPQATPPAVVKAAPAPPEKSAYTDPFGGDTVPPPPEKPEPPKPFPFVPGDVLQTDADPNYVLVLEAPPGLGWVSLVDLVIDAEPFQRPTSVVQEFTFVAHPTPLHPVALREFVNTATFEPVDPEKVQHGSMQIGSKTPTGGVFLGLYSEGGSAGYEYLEGFERTLGPFTYPAFRFQSLKVPQAKATYQPTAPAPEPASAHVEGGDEEAGDPEMCGTQEAIDWLIERGWALGTQSESKHFGWALGEHRSYKSASTRLIVGYGFQPAVIAGEAGVPVYVIRTETGKLNWVVCTNAHKKYGAVFELHAPTLAALKPKPGAEAKAKWPRVPYHLTPLVKKLLTEAIDLVPVAPPTKRIAYVGTPMVSKGGAQRTLGAWFTSPEFTEPHALMVDEEHSTWIAVSVESLAGAWSVSYKTATEILADGSFSIGKTGESAFSLTTVGAGLPSLELPDGWETPPDVPQPPMGALPPTHKRVSAGVVVILPPNSIFTIGSQIKHVGVPHVVLVRPVGKFKGYSFMLPKGTVGEGEGLMTAAVREVFEETGLTVRPVAFLGDYKGTEAVTRMYVGYITGGSPGKKSKPEETDGIVFKSMAPDFELMSWFASLVPVGTSSTWQQSCLKDAADWIKENGLPHEYHGQVATSDAAVTAPQDTASVVASAPAGTFTDPFAAAPLKIDEETGHQKEQWKKPEDGDWKPTIPASALYDDVWKTLLFKCPFPMTTLMVSVLKKKALITGKPTSFAVARSREVGPKFGEVFETTAGTPYTAAGYVSWLAEGGATAHFLLGATPGGEVEAIPCDLNGFKDGHVLKDQTLANAQQDAWFTHPDPAVNKSIQDVFHAGGSLVGVPVNMQQFKVSWLKAAGVPAYAVVTSNLLGDVCSMFVPGACSQFQHDAIIASLKARMQATHSKPKDAPSATTAVGAPVAAPPVPAPLSAGVPALAPTTVAVPAGIFSPIHRQYVNNPQPHLFVNAGGVQGVHKQAGGSYSSVGGSKPSGLIRGPGGTKWFAKWAPSEVENYRADIDASAYRFCSLCKDNNVPVGVMDFEGKHISFQPFSENAVVPPLDPAVLLGSQMAEVLAQHAADMFMGDHDGTVGNWIMVGGQMVAIDRGQAWKFVLQNKAESLDPTWHAPGNIGQGYAKELLLKWAKKDADIPAVAWAAMLKTIRGIAQVTDAQLLGVLAPVFDSSLKTIPADRERVLATLKKRRDSYEADWTAVLRKLRKDFKWPTVGAVAAPKAHFESSPADMRFGKREEKAIADAVTSGWKGKVIRADKDGIEGQEVMVRRVTWQQGNGVTTAATLMHWRVARLAGVKAAKKMFSAKGTEFNDDAGGPHRLKIDQQRGYWEKIWAAIKSINFHLSKQKDTKVNANTITAVQALVPELTKLTEATVKPGGEYAPTNEPNEAVFAMAEQYLQYANIISYWMSHVDELVGQHSPTFAEFLWEDPPTDAPKVVEAPPYKVYAKQQGALWPKCVVSGAKVHVENLNKPQYNSSQQSQFVVEDPLTGARIFWNPPGEVGLTGIKKGTESQKGQAWAIIPGEPSPATVAHVLKLFQSASGIDMAAATEDDNEVLYWSRQAAHLQEGGAPTPDSNSEIVKEKPYVAAMGLYRDGKPKEAIAALQAFVAQKLGKTVAETRALASPDEIAGVYDKDGAGFVRQTRIGWTRDRLVKTLGADCRVAHHLAEDPLTWMQAMQNNGALLSNAIKPFYGVTKTGASPGADMERGGGQGIFCCFRKGFDDSKGMIYFDISLALRLDLYIVGTGDTYGDTTHTRYMTPEQWVQLGAHKKVGHCSASSNMQVSVRHDIDIRTYLVRVIAGNQAGPCIQIAKKLGWTFYGGLKPEQVFV